MRRPNHSSGQALLIAIMIGVVLFLSVPIVIFFNQMNSSHQAQTEKRQKNLIVAREAVAFAKNIVASDWANAVSNNFASPTLAPYCGGATITGVDGSHFKVNCDKPTTAQVYQVRVVGQALNLVNGTEIAVSALEAYVSPQTVAVNLPEDLRASVAVQLTNVPPTPNTVPASSTYKGNFTVHWGPISCMDQSSKLDLTFATLMDAGRYPRKFLNNGLIYTNAARSIPAAVSSDRPTDLAEFWAYQILGFSAPVNDALYQASALSGINPPHPAPTVPGCVGGPCGTAITGAGTGFYTVALGDTALLDSTFATGLPGNTTIYINGDAEIANNFTWDGKNGGALIVTGSLYVDTPPPAPLTAALRIPPTANLEYPYYPTSPTDWPCRTSWTASGGLCSPPPPYHVRGFIWAKNNLIVEAPGWGFAGTLLVGDPSNSSLTGQLNILPTADLTVYYDDEINHLIRVVSPPGYTPLQSDSLREISAQ
jgi:hypothetical protein